MVPAKKYQKIKENVWKYEKDGTFYSVKEYRSTELSAKVKKIHETLSTLSFPHIVPIVKSTDEKTVIQPWITGAKPVNFRKWQDRIDSLAALKALHLTGNEVDWSVSPFLETYPLLAKWEDRLSRFYTCKPLIERIVGNKAFEEIVFFATNALPSVRKIDYEKAKLTLLHGDVVHHNILRDQDGIIRLIDFDLACIGPAGIEIALWVHRVLPQIQYDIHFLMNEQPELYEMLFSSLPLLLYPNEVLREWIHFSSLPPHKQERQIKHLLPFTESALNHWPKLWYDVERMME